MCFDYRKKLSKGLCRGALITAIAALPASLVAESDVAQMIYRLSFDAEPVSGASLLNDGGIGTLAAGVANSGYVNYQGENGDGVTKPNPRFGTYCLRTNGGVPSFRNAEGIGLSGKGGFTISFWFWPNDATSWRNCFGFRLGTQNFRFEQQYTPQFLIYPTAANAESAIIVAGNYTQKAWNHVAVAVESNTLTIYANGVKTTTVALAEAIDGEGLLTEVIAGWGRSEGTLSTALRGERLAAWMDEVAIFDRALSADAITWLNANPAAVPFIHPQLAVGEDSYLTVSTWAWPGDPESLDAISNLVITGSGERNLAVDQNITIAGTLTVLQSGSSEATDLMLAYNENGFMEVQGETVICTDTIVEAGAARLANVRVDPGKTLEIQDNSTLTGDVLIPAGATLILRSGASPLWGVTSLTIEEGATLQLPFDGTYAISVLESGELICAGVVLDENGTRIFGSVYDGIFIPVGPLVWTAPSGTWAEHWWQELAIPTDAKPLTFAETASGLAEVTVSGSVLPLALLFENAATAYTFLDGGSSPLISLETALATLPSGAPVTFNVPLALNSEESVTISDGSRLKLTRPFGTLPAEGSDATCASPIQIGEAATFAIETAEGATQALNTAFTGNGALDISGAGRVVLKQTLPDFTGQINLSGATLRIEASNSADGVFINPIFNTQTPLNVTHGGTVEFNIENSVGYAAAHRESFFADFGEGTTLRRIISGKSESMTRGLIFSGSAQVIDESATNPWRLRSGITLKATSGTTTFNQVAGGKGFLLFNDGSGGAATANRTFFDVAPGAAIIFNSLLADNGNANSGLRKIGGGTLGFAGAVTTSRPIEIDEGILSVTGASTGNAAYTIGDGTNPATLTGTGSIGGTGGVTINPGATIETGLTITKLTLNDAATVYLKDTSSTIATTTLIAPASAAVAINVSVVPATAVGKICDVLTWSGEAPAAAFTITGTESRTFLLKITENALELHRKQGTYISLY